MKRRLTDKPEPPVNPRVSLAEIAGAVIDLDCPLCGRHSEITATALMKAVGGAATLASALGRMRCSQCARKGAPEIRIRAGPRASPFDARDEDG